EDEGNLVRLRAEDDNWDQRDWLGTASHVTQQGHVLEVVTARDTVLIIKLDDADSQNYNPAPLSSFSYDDVHIPQKPILPYFLPPLSTACLTHMRESNFAFPLQNRASVCISSQLYDRRATSPRIREIMTMDGGLERLVRILHDFCISPPSPENPAVLYGLLPLNHHPPKPLPTLNPKSFDKHAAHRFSLAFQCVVNIGVRGSEPIRSRVVQAGTLDVVGCILEAWLASKGFAVGPSSSASGMPRESREQRVARRQAQAEQRSREQAAELARALQRPQLSRRDYERISEHEMTPAEDDNAVNDESMDITATPDTSMVIQENISVLSSPTPVSDPPSAVSVDTDADTSTDTSTNATPAGSNTPTGTVEVPGRDRSGTIIARPIWDTAITIHPRRNFRTRDRQGTVISPSTSANTSRAETETEDDADVDMDRDQSRETTDTSPSPEPMAISRPPQTSPHTRRAVGIVSDATTQTATGASLELNTDAHIIINHDQDVGGEGVGVEDGIVSLEPNDDFAMGAPPGAPGAIETARTVRPNEGARRGRNDLTPRAVNTNLPFTTPGTAGRVNRGSDGEEDTPVRPNAPMQRNLPLPAVARGVPTITADGAATVRASGHGHHHHHHREPDMGPYGDEDVLLSLQLLAYLSKYPHVRQAFYKPRTSFHPASATLRIGEHLGAAQASTSSATAGPSNPSSGKELSSSSSHFLRMIGRGKGKEPAPPPSAPYPATTSSASNPPFSTRQTNVFSLVERFTFRPSSSENDLPNPPPTLPAEIQYWAGVIMRNACRKDDSRGGIRQCANMLCGRWESYPREFAKCRRCRKAKYCGKECQSTAWSEGHRFWCSAKDGDDDPEHAHAHGDISGRSEGTGTDTALGAATTSEGTVTGRADRRVERDRERVRDRVERDRERVRERVMATTAATGANTAEVARAVAHVIRQMPSNLVPRPGDAEGAAGTRRERGVGNERELADGNAGWGRAFYEPSPFVGQGERGARDVYLSPFQGRRFGPGEIANGSPAALTLERRAETMPGGMVPVVDSPSRTTVLSRYLDQPAVAEGGGRTDVSMIAGPSRVVRQDDGEVYGLSGDDISMDVD
ncbi:hypothetical protein EW146_g7931, partial [Bondarzewia mesenterica]